MVKISDITDKDCLEIIEDVLESHFLNLRDVDGEQAIIFRYVMDKIKINIKDNKWRMTNANSTNEKKIKKI